MSNDEEIVQVPQETNCGNSVNCFIDAAKSCTLATASFSKDRNVFGILYSDTTFYRIEKSSESNKCILYLRFDNANLKFDQEIIDLWLKDGITMDKIQQQLETERSKQRKMLGRDGRCEFNTFNDLYDLLHKWLVLKSFSYGFTFDLATGKGTSEGDLVKAQCSGEYFTTDPLVQPYAE